MRLKLDKTNIDINEIYQWDKKIKEIHNKIQNKVSVGSEMMEWYFINKWELQDEIIEINKKVNELKNELKVEILLTIGIGGSFLGAKSGIDFIKGSILGSENVIFTGINVSSSQIKQIEQKLKGKKWAICVISKSGTTLEPMIAFKYFKNLLLKEISHNEIHKYIIAITDKEKGILKEIAIKNSYTTFDIKNGIGGRFSGFSPVGLFPMSFAGVDIFKVLDGFFQAKKEFSVGDIKKNQAYQYAVVRNIINKKYNLPIEIFITYNLDLESFSQWWQQLFGESEGKENKGIFPTYLSFSRDLHSMGQFIQEGKKIFFETTIWVKNQKDDVIVEDESNSIYNNSLNHINESLFLSTLKAHYQQRQIPNIVIEIDKQDEYNLGYLWFFFFVSITISCYLIEVNPFNQNGVEIYKKNLIEKLSYKKGIK